VLQASSLDAKKGRQARQSRVRVTYASAADSSTSKPPR
jgi:hypothetical protein